MKVCKVICHAIVATMLWLPSVSLAQEYPFQDSTLTVGERIDDLLSRMTIEEKIDLLSGYENFHLHPCERLGIPAFHLADGPLGIASWGIYGRATAFPATLAMTASWDRQLASEMGQMYAQEWRARGLHFMLAPGVNLYRASKSARNFEYMGEDPYLASEMVVPFIQGVQDGGVIATVKHFAANDQEFDRYRVSTEVDERTLHELYLAPFRAAVERGGVRAVMTGYNLVNGTYCTENATLIDILKRDWGFQGMLMRDWACTYSPEAAIRGLDLEMGSNDWLIRDKLLPMLADGSITEEMIDEKVRRIYTPCMEMGFFDRPQLDPTIPRFNHAANALALHAAEQGIVMLKNADALLPLCPDSIRSIAVIGPNASHSLINDATSSVAPICYGGGGSSRVHPWYVISPLEGIQEEFPQATIYYAEGISPLFMNNLYQGSIFFTPEGERGLSARYYKGSSTDMQPVAERRENQVNFQWEGRPDIDAELGDEYAIVWEGYIEAAKTDSLLLFVDGQGGMRLSVAGEVVYDAADEPSFISGRKAIAVEQGERLPIRLEYYNNNCLPAEGHFGYAYQSDVDFSEALRLARQADVVVVCAGLNGMIEKEGRDRPFELPYGQDLLISELHKVNPRLVVTLHGGGGVDMSRWVDDMPAILHLLYPGQEGGRALAHILSGKVNPSGRLPFSIERQWADSPAYGGYDETRNERRVYYREGLMMGYRGYDKRGMEPLYPFGHGLSYTTFDYRDIDVEIADDDPDSLRVNVGFTLVNTGERRGAEVAQLYVAPDESSAVERPVKELKGFEKVWLEPGEERRVVIPLTREAFSYYSAEDHQWHIQPGAFTFIIGAAASDPRLTTKATIGLQ
ncbi:MAG: glycoside hydrolase family 3 C-terminal domain-containing protein [Bacteroidales bacterium]|nr:glycoside hydrolase family 3 C-terminal domain-containing protein [Bacteroidales bacterium]